MTVRTIQAELMLLSWAETSNGGAKVVFQLADTADLEPFKSLTLAKGKQAGQRFMAVLALVEDDAPEPDPVKRTIGPRCQLAVRWCEMPEFWWWLNRVYPDTSGNYGGGDKFTAPKIMRALLEVKSRAEIDGNPALEARFDTLFRDPFSDYLRRTHAE